MSLSGEQTVEETLAQLERDGIEYLWVSYHDYSGRACAKTIPRKAFHSVLQEGVVFAMANLNMDALDHQMPDAVLLADSGDFLAIPDPRSYTVLPLYPNTARMYAWMRDAIGGAWVGCPRTRLVRMVRELAEAGFSAQVAYEPEFYLLTRDTDGEYQPINRSQMFSQAGLATENAFTQHLLGTLDQMGLRIPQFGKEYGPGQYELAIHHTDPIQAVDDYLTIRETVRDVARERGSIATFIPKLYTDWPGCSLHLHLSLWDVASEVNRTVAIDNDEALSQETTWFMGGLLTHVDALTGLGAPTVNSYKRLQPGTWAPANSYWGYGNRSGVIRIPGTGNRRRIEFRVSDNTCQPYLFLTGVLAAGLDGIRRQLDPGAPFQGDIGHLTAAQIADRRLGYLPRTLPDALDALAADEVLGDALGAEALGHFLRVKRHEFAQFEQHVHPWERETYLEGI